MEKIERRREKQQRKTLAHENRLAKIRAQEEARIRKAQEQAEKPNKITQQKQKEILDMSAEQIIEMDQFHMFKKDEFDSFSEELTNVLDKMSQFEASSSFGIDFKELAKKWKVQHKRIKCLASKKENKRDKRFKLFQQQVDQAKNERDLLAIEKKELEQRIHNLLFTPQFVTQFNELKNMMKQPEQTAQSQQSAMLLNGDSQPAVELHPNQVVNGSEPNDVLNQAVQSLTQYTVAANLGHSQQSAHASNFAGTSSQTLHNVHLNAYHTAQSRDQIAVMFDTPVWRQ